MEEKMLTEKVLISEDLTWDRVATLHASQQARVLHAFMQHTSSAYHGITLLQKQPYIYTPAIA